jgi:glycosyltransferase involved in cell wall biosynthesis
MKILYIDGDGPLGGASRSLYELVSHLKPLGVKPYILVTRGTVVPYYSEIAEEISTTYGLTRFDNTKYSHYRGVRWLIVLRELLRLPSTLKSIYKAYKTWKEIDLIHVNELTEIVPAVIAKKLFKIPIVVHSRSLFWNEPSAMRFKWIKRMVLKHIDLIIPIDESVEATLPKEFNTFVVHNSFTPKYAKTSDNQFIQKIDNLRKDTFKVGFVGNLLHGKGLIEIIEAAKILKERKIKVDIIIVGDEIRSIKGLKALILKSIGLSQSLKSEMIQKINEYKLEESIHLMGSTYDIQPIYERFDVLCFPSHFDAPGRPIFEAAFSGIPSIAAINNPKPDTFIHLGTGMAIPPRDHIKLADAIEYMAKNPEHTKQMGINAKELAVKNFTPSTNAKQVFEQYNKLLNKKHN